MPSTYETEVEVIQSTIRERINKHYGVEGGIAYLDYTSAYDSGDKAFFRALCANREPERLEAWRQYFLTHTGEWKYAVDLRNFDLFGAELNACDKEFATGVEESILDTALAIASDYDERLIALHFAILSEDARAGAAAKVGAAIKEARIAKGLTLTQLASRAGTYRQHIANIEAGEVNINIDTLAAIGAALGRSFVV